jgi:hypothetical protein
MILGVEAARLNSAALYNYLRANFWRHNTVIGLFQTTDPFVQYKGQQSDDCQYKGHTADYPLHRDYFGGDTGKEGADGHEAELDMRQAHYPPHKRRLSIRLQECVTQGTSQS